MDATTRRALLDGLRQRRLVSGSGASDPAYGAWVRARRRSGGRLTRWDVRRVRAHPVNSRTGERKIPPPVAARPDSKPIAPPTMTPGALPEVPHSILCVTRCWREMDSNHRSRFTYSPLRDPLLSAPRRSRSPKRKSPFRDRLSSVRRLTPPSRRRFAHTVNTRSALIASFIGSVGGLALHEQLCFLGDAQAGVARG
jgi:hypothetical protein